MHEVDNAYLIRSNLVVLSAVWFLMVAYNAKHYILNLLLINLLLSFLVIWINHYDSMVSLGAELDSQSFDYIWNVLLLFSGVVLSIR